MYIPIALFAEVVNDCIVPLFVTVPVLKPAPTPNMPVTLSPIDIVFVFVPVDEIAVPSA